MSLTSAWSTVGASAPGANADPIRLGDNGRVHGIDGMLDQVSSALARQAVPMLSRDAALQQNVGDAIGKAFAEEATPWIAVGASALAVIAVVLVARWHRESR